VIAVVVVGLAVLLNLVATVALVRSDSESPRQKAVQLVLIWAVPVVGAIVVIAALKGAASWRVRGE
jgi:hypothetical protein